MIYHFLIITILIVNKILSAGDDIDDLPPEYWQALVSIFVTPDSNQPPAADPNIPSAQLAPDPWEELLEIPCDQGAPKEEFGGANWDKAIDIPRDPGAPEEEFGGANWDRAIDIPRDPGAPEEEFGDKNWENAINIREDRGAPLEKTQPESVQRNFAQQPPITADIPSNVLADHPHPTRECSQPPKKIQALEGNPEADTIDFTQDQGPMVEVNFWLPLKLFFDDSTLLFEYCRLYIICVAHDHFTNEAIADNVINFFYNNQENKNLRDSCRSFEFPKQPGKLFKKTTLDAHLSKVKRATNANELAEFFKNYTLLLGNKNLYTYKLRKKNAAYAVTIAPNLEFFCANNISILRPLTLVTGLTSIESIETILDYLQGLKVKIPQSFLTQLRNRSLPACFETPPSHSVFYVAPTPCKPNPLPSQNPKKPGDGSGARYQTNKFSVDLPVLKLTDATARTIDLEQRKSDTQTRQQAMFELFLISHPLEDYELEIYEQAEESNLSFSIPHHQLHHGLQEQLPFLISLPMERMPADFQTPQTYDIDDSTSISITPASNSILNTFAYLAQQSIAARLLFSLMVWQLHSQLSNNIPVRAGSSMQTVH